MFSTLDAYRSFNIIDSLIIEDAIRVHENEGAYEKARQELQKVYLRNTTVFTDEDVEQMYGTRSDYSKPIKGMPTYTEPTEDGYLGLGPALE